MKILFDENVPRPLKQFLSEHEVVTVQDAGWTGLGNGDIIKNAENNFDIFVLADKNLRYQQNLANRNIAIVELPTNRWPILKKISSKITKSIDAAKPGSYIIIEE